MPLIELTNLLGKWQVYETGYSAGGGYIIKAVPEAPAQILSFLPRNQFSSNYPGLETFSYYHIFNDSLEGNILALYKEIPDDEEYEDINNLNNSYAIQYDAGNVKLSFRYCIEGCHIGIKKME